MKLKKNSKKSYLVRRGRQAGVCLHISSLPGDHGIGDIADAGGLADLAAAGDELEIRRGEVIALSVVAAPPGSEDADDTATDDGTTAEPTS